MAFKTDQTREKARELIAQGKPTKEIAEALSGQCTTQDIYSLKHSMQKSGTAKKAKGQRTNPALKESVPIVPVLIAEQTRLRNRTTQLEYLLGIYSELKKGSPFKNAVEEELDRMEKRLDAIND